MSVSEGHAQDLKSEESQYAGGTKEAPCMRLTELIFLTSANVPLPCCCLSGDTFIDTTLVILDSSALY